MVDFHNHLIPGVDDGASSDAEARSGLDALWAQGVHTIVATPHVDGSLTAQPALLSERLADLDEGWQRLQSVAADMAADGGASLVLHRGAEVALDTPEPDISDERLRLGGGRFVLVEFPFMSVPPHSERVIRHIATAGFIPIVAHPERYMGITVEAHLPAHWREHGALLQVNEGSLLGQYGPAAHEMAFRLLAQGIVDFLCSDYHARGRPPTARARDTLVELDATEQADLLMIVNPTRMLDGHPPIPVPPLRRRRSLADRVRNWLR